MPNLLQPILAYDNRMACDIVLEKMKLARDALLDAIVLDPLAEEYEIRGRRVNRGDAMAKLEKLEELIDSREARGDRLAHGRSRNIYNLVNP